MSHCLSLSILHVALICLNIPQSSSICLRRPTTNGEQNPHTPLIECIGHCCIVALLMLACRIDIGCVFHDMPHACVSH